jgi:sugar lactone lactonase YvrE
MTNVNDFKILGTAQVGKQATTKVGSSTSSTETYRVADLVQAQVSTLGLGPTPQRIRFKPDGTVMYINETTNDRVNQYNLSSAWDVTTLSADGFLDYSPPVNIAQDFILSHTGRNLFVFSSSPADTIYRYDIDPAYDISGVTTSDQNASFAPGAGGGFNSMAFNGDGTRLFLKSNGSNVVSYYDLGTAYDLSTAGSESTITITGGDTGADEMEFTNNGFTFTLFEFSNDVVQVFTLSAAYDLSTATLTDTSPTLPRAGLRYPTFGDSGNLVFFMDAGVDDIYAYDSVATILSLDLSTGNYFDLVTEDYREVKFVNVPATGSQTFTLNVSAQTGFGMFVGGTQTEYITDYELPSGEATNGAVWSNFGGVCMTRNGRHILSSADTGSGAGRIYRLDTPYDPRTATLISWIDSNSVYDNSDNAFLREDGRKAYVGGTTSLKELDLDPPFSLPASATTTINPGGARCIFFKPDGTRYFCMNVVSSSTVSTFDLSTPWDISTAVDATINLATASTTAVGGLQLSDDGEFLYVIGSGADNNIYAYRLTTPWDVSSASFLGSADYGIKATNAFFVHPSQNLIVYFEQLAGVPSEVSASTFNATFFSPVFQDTILWADGTAPTYDATNNNKLITLSTNDGGATYVAGYEDVNL